MATAAQKTAAAKKARAARSGTRALGRVTAGLDKLNLGPGTSTRRGSDGGIRVKTPGGQVIKATRGNGGNIITIRGKKAAGAAAAAPTRKIGVTKGIGAANVKRLATARDIMNRKSKKGKQIAKGAVASRTKGAGLG